VVDVAIVDDKKSIVGLLEGFDCDGWVLCVVLFEVEGELLGNSFGKNGGGDAFPAFGQQGEDCVVHVVVDQKQAFFRLANEVGGKSVDDLNSDLDSSFTA